jgi:hypothetical protein
MLIWTAIGLLGGGSSRPGQPAEPRLLTWLTRRLPVAADGGYRRLVMRRSGHLLATPLLVAVIAVGVADVLFAFADYI